MAADWEIDWDLDAIPPQLEAAVPIALETGAEHVRGVAVTRAPHGQTGHLVNDSGVTVEGAGFTAVAAVKFPGPYAAFQNRGMRADGTHIIENRPAGGQTGFLTETMNDQADAARDVMADTIWKLLG